MALPVWVSPRMNSLTALHPETFIVSKGVRDRITSTAQRNVSEGFLWVHLPVHAGGQMIDSFNSPVMARAIHEGVVCTIRFYSFKNFSVTKKVDCGFEAARSTFTRIKNHKCSQAPLAIKHLRVMNNSLWQHICRCFILSKKSQTFNVAVCWTSWGSISQSIQLNKWVLLHNSPPSKKYKWWSRC